MTMIIALNRYYRPDHSATAQILTDLMEHLAASGQDAAVIATRNAYGGDARFAARETLGGVAVRRVSATRLAATRLGLVGRAVDYLSFYLLAFLALLRTARRGDVVLAKTDPPLASALGGIACRLTGAKLVTWNQDLFPEVAGALGMGWANGPLGAPLRALRNRSLHAAAMNIAINRPMAARLEALGVDPARIAICENWCDPGIRPVAAADNPLRAGWGLADPAPNAATGPATGLAIGPAPAPSLVLGYSGNLGRAHMPARVADLVRASLKVEGLSWVFIGGGPGLAAIRAIAETAPDRVQLRPYQPRERLSESLSVPDLHLVALDPGCEGLIMPSKFYGVMAAGRGVLAFGAPDGAVAEEAAQDGAGLHLDPDAPETWVPALTRLAAEPARVAAMGAAARRAYETRMQASRALARLAAAVTGAAEGAAAKPALEPAE